MLQRLRSRGLRQGILGGSRPWMVVAALTWALRALHLAVRRRPVTVYRGRIRAGESLTVVEHPAGWRPGR